MPGRCKTFFSFTKVFSPDKLFLIWLVCALLQSCSQAPGTLDPYSGLLATEVITQPDVMPEKEFWHIIDRQSIAWGHQYDKFNEAISFELSGYEVFTMTRFQNTFNVLLEYSNTHQLQQAVQIIFPDCDDLCFFQFRSWLVSLGKNPFYQLVENPDRLALLETIEFKGYWSGLDFAAENAYRKKTGLSGLPQNPINKWPRGKRVPSKEKKKYFPEIFKKYVYK